LITVSILLAECIRCSVRK